MIKPYHTNYLESTWHCFADAAFSGKFAFPICEDSARATARHTLRNFSCMVTTSCMSMAVNNIGAEWLLRGNIICNVLMACCRCFLYMYQITIALQVG